MNDWIVIVTDIKIYAALSKDKILSEKVPKRWMFTRKNADNKILRITLFGSIFDYLLPLWGTT